MKKVAALGALLTFAARGIALPDIAHATPLFVGTYTAVQKSSSIHDPTEASGAGPDQNAIWVVRSSCALVGCLAHVVIGQALTDFDMIFDGTKWDRLALPPIGTCNGATVPARSAQEFLVPQANGSLTGATTSTVDCNGTSVDLSQPLNLTPS